MGYDLKKDYRTLAILKSNTIARGLAPTILNRIEDDHLKIITCKLVHLTTSQIEQLYVDRLFDNAYPQLYRHVSGPMGVMILVLESNDPDNPNAVEKWLTLLGDEDRRRTRPGTLRYQYGGQNYDPSSHWADNVAHGSSSVDDARREIMLFFPDLDDIELQTNFQGRRAGDIDFPEVPEKEIRIAEITAAYQTAYRLGFIGEEFRNDHLAGSRAYIACEVGYATGRHIASLCGRFNEDMEELEPDES